MRLFLLGIIFLLLLTLGNAWLYQASAFNGSRDFSILQITYDHQVLYSRYLFLWREIAAVILTVVLFGAIAWSGYKRPRRVKYRR